MPIIGPPDEYEKPTVEKEITPVSAFSEEKWAQVKAILDTPNKKCPECQAVNCGLNKRCAYCFGRRKTIVELER